MDTSRIKVCFIAYAEYYNDARIKSYVNILNGAGYKVDLYCLRDDYTKSLNDRLRVSFLGKKYQGNSKILYSLNYLSFFLLCFLKVNYNFFKEKYKIFHVHNQPDFLIFIPVIAKIFQSKLILDLHDIMIAGVLSKFGGNSKGVTFKFTRFQTMLSVKFAHALIVADHSQKDYLKENGIEHRDCHVFLNLPNEDFFQRGSLQHNSGSKTRLIFHGTLAERLGLDIVIKAVEKASETVGVDFTMIGDGDSKTELVDYCKAKGILDKIIYFKPFIPVENLQNEILKYNIGVIGNKRSLISEKCMLPVKLMEYLYIGIPVIAPRLEVIQRYFTEDMVEFYEPENIDELAEKILKLAVDYKKRKNMVEKSSIFFDKYNWVSQSRAYLKLIDNLISD